MPDAIHLRPVDGNLQEVAQRLVCWSLGDYRVRVRTGSKPTIISVDREICRENRYGPLQLKPGGPIIACDPNAASPVIIDVYQDHVVYLDPNTCVEQDTTLDADWVAATAQRTIRVNVTGVANIRIQWGDGTLDYHGPSSGGITHTYAATGTYTATVSRLGDPTVRIELPVIIKSGNPTIHAYSDPDDDWRALLWIDEPGDGTHYSVDWGDGTPPEDVRRDPPPFPRRPHDYTALGSYTIAITDTSSRRKTTLVYDVAEIGMLWQFATDDRIPHLVASRMKVGATWTLDWGDGTPPQTGTVPANASLRIDHDGIMDPGEYSATVTEIVNGTPRRTATRDLIIPSVFNLRMQVGLSWRRTTRSIRTITVTPVQTPPEVTCTVNWGDGSPTETVNGGSPIEHDYVFPFPPQGHTLHVVENTGEQRHFTRLMGEPSYIGHPHQSAWTPRSVDIYVSGIPGTTNADWYQIDWGDGNISNLGAVGAHWLAWHEYPHTGSFTIRVDGPGMSDPVTRSITVADYPSPAITTREDTTDTTRMTTIATVDNSRCGGQAELHFDDATPNIIVDEVSQTPHQYAAAGLHTLIVTCLADPTARARAYASVPYGPASTLQAHVHADPGGNLYTAQVVVDAYDVSKTITVAWDDGTSGQITPPTASHLYAFGDDYLITVAYGDGSEEHGYPTTIPFPGA